MQAPDILPEQAVARLFERRELIVAAALPATTAGVAPRDQQAAQNLHALWAATDIRQYLECVHERLVKIESPTADYVIKLADKARQLEAYQLLQLESSNC